MLVLAAAELAQASRPSVGGARAACRRADALYGSNHARAEELSRPKAMQQQTDPARLCGVRAVPQAVLAQGTRTTVLDSGSVEHPQAAIGFTALFGGMQGLACPIAQCPIRLEDKIALREAASFPGQSDPGAGITCHRSRFGLPLWQGSSKFGSAQRSWLQLMPQFEAEVPDPLADDLPGFLATRGMRTPPIRVLFLSNCLSTV